MSGNVIYTPSGGFLFNCRMHTQGGDGATGERAVIVECGADPTYGDGHLSNPGAPWRGVQVITPTGDVYTNCKFHRP